MIVPPFRPNAWPTLGVEVELQLVDGSTFALRSAVREVLDRLPDALKADAVKPEFLQCYVEVSTGVCRTAGEVGTDLASTLAAVDGAARAAGLRLAWGATHPFSHWRSQSVTPNPRYRALAEELRETVLRPATFGLHVHVGVPSGDAAVGVMARIREHLPVLLALSANSPFWCGRATGHQAHRLELLEAFPTGGLPPALPGWDAYSGLVARLAGTGVIQSPKELWWDVRPNSTFGTVEVRVCDVPADLGAVVGLTALIQCLVARLAAEPVPACGGAATVDETCRSIALRQNRWRAARHGLEAPLVDPETGRTVRARDAALALIDSLAPEADRFGCAREVAVARSLAGGPTGAERQLATYRSTQSLAEVVRELTGERAPLSPAPHVSLGAPSPTPSWSHFLAARTGD